MIPAERFKNNLNWLGSGLSLLAVIFVAFKLRDLGHEINVPALVPLTIPLVGLAFFWACSCVMLAYAWRDLLRHFGLEMKASSAIRMYGLSQLSKYVPGNIFQFVGRQALGLQAGLPMWPLAKSAAWEVGLLAFCGSTFLILISPAWMQPLSIWLALAGWMAAVVTSVWCSGRWLGPCVAKALGRYFIFLTLSGLLFLVVVMRVTLDQPYSFPASILICASYIVAWLAGLLTPGAPAGIGIREVVLLALLSPVLGEANLLTAVVLGRLVTMAGDLVFFLGALAIKKEPPATG